MTTYEWHTLPVVEETIASGPSAGFRRRPDTSSLGEYKGIVNIVYGEGEALCLVAK
jgi:hypothetical protein